jgi:peptidoglycan/LPS O-acetylase OafA/YrhL
MIVMSGAPEARGEAEMCGADASSGEQSVAVTPHRRLHYIDWLRVLAVLLLFPFHSARVFNGYVVPGRGVVGEPFYVKGAELSSVLGWMLGFIDRWHMPLLFLLAGASTYFALGKRTPGQYVSERVLRLVVPLVFGFFVLIPPQTWLGGRFNSGYPASFWAYLSSGAFLAFNIRDGGDYYGGFGIGHLWFILFLFILSMAALPLLVWIRNRRGGQAQDQVADRPRRLAAVSWWLVPPVVLWFAEGMPELGGKNIFYYLAWFLLGFLAIRGQAFLAAAERLSWPVLAAGAAICAASLLVGPFRDSLPDPSWPLAGLNILGMLGAWLVVAGLMGLGKRYLDRPSPQLTYLAEASYPVYILHQTVIVVLAFYLVRVVPGAWTGFAAVLATSVAATVALYEGVRRVAPLRVLFGMKQATRPAVAVSETAQA